jgi:hypothetical protein
VKILNFRTIDNAGALIAAFDVEFVPLTIHGMKLFRKSDGATFISEPSEKFEKDGATKYRRHVHISDEVIRAKIETQAKEIYQARAGQTPPADDTIPF